MPADTPEPPGRAVRQFSRFQLLRLLGRSSQTMAWLASDPRSGEEVVVVLARQALADDSRVLAWSQQAQQAARVSHPGLAPALEIDCHDRWPYAVYRRGHSVTLSERVGDAGIGGREAVIAMRPALHGLAAAHDVSVVHGDLQLHLLALHEPQGCQLMGLGMVASPGGSVARRAAADVLAFGLALHQALVGEPPLDDADLTEAARRLAPTGNDWVRLPQRDGLNIAQALRAIVNRATDRQERLRYRNARTLARALEGWLEGDADRHAGALALLTERIRRAGTLPAVPGGAQRAASLQRMDDKRVDQLSEVLLPNPGLFIELLRRANSAGVRGASAIGNGSILTVKRALALLGLDHVAHVARVIKPWPGSLAAAHVGAFEHELRLACHAGRVAQWLRPAGYDGELVYLLAVFQRAGKLLLRYHFPDEAAQIHRLTLPTTTLPAGTVLPGLSEQSASYAVLGFDFDAVAWALAQGWGFEPSALAMMRRWPADAPVHAATRDAEVLRGIASCANELVEQQFDSQGNAGASALRRLAERWAPLLRLTEHDLRLAVRGTPPASTADPSAAVSGSDAPQAAETTHL